MLSPWERVPHPVTYEAYRADIDPPTLLPYRAVAWRRLLPRQTLAPNPRELTFDSLPDLDLAERVEAPTQRNA